MSESDLQEIQAAATRIQRLSDEHWHVLDATCRAMDENAWVGPAGRRFRSTAHATRRELQAQLANAVRDAQTKLASARRNSS
jgi:hypothetical protein